MTDPRRETIEGAAVTTPILTLLRIEASGAPPICVVSNTEPITALGEVYIPIALEFRPPSLSEDAGVADGSLVLDTTDLGAQRLLATIREPPKLRVDIIVASAPDDPLASYHGLVLLDPRIFRTPEGGERCEWRVSTSATIARMYPTRRFTPARWPGLFP